MERDIEAARVGLKSAVEKERPDVFRAILSTLEEIEVTRHVGIINIILAESVCDDGTLLHLATKLKLADMVRILLDAGAHPGLTNADGKSPLDYLESDDPIVEVYEQELLKASAQSDVERVSEFISAGISVNTVDSLDTNNSLLHWAATYGNRSIVRYLCESGASVNAVNSDGMTPLHDAVTRGEGPIVEELIQQGADPECVFTNKDGEEVSAVKLAEGNTELLEILKSRKLVSLEQSNDEPGSGVNTAEISTSKLVPNGSIPSPIISDPSSPQPDMTSLTFTLTSPSFQGLQIENKTLLLWPPPQVISMRRGSTFTVPKSLTVFIIPGPTSDVPPSLMAWKLRSANFLTLGVTIDAGIYLSSINLTQPHVTCHVNSRLCHGPETYKVTVFNDHVKILAADQCGLMHAISTLLQLFILYRQETSIAIPQLQIDDWPEHKVRGVLFVITQRRVLSMDLLKSNVDRLSLMKVNQIHLFAKFRENHWTVSYSQSELIELGSYCRERHIEMVPVLEVTPNIQFENLPELYDTLHDYISCFPQTRFVSLGPRLSSLVISVPDDDTVNFGDIYKLLPVRRSHTLMFCGYPLLDVSDAALRSVPPSYLLMLYGVKGDYNFRTLAERLSEAGLSFCCCPETAAWNSLAGCPEATLLSVGSALKCTSDLDGLGAVICNWSGSGSAAGLMSYDFVSWPGYVLSAGLTWNSYSQLNVGHDLLSEILTLYVFTDLKSSIGSIIMELGKVETCVQRLILKHPDDIGHLPDNRGSVLLQLLVQPDIVQLESLSPETFQKVIRHVKKCQTELGHYQLNDAQNDVAAEITLTIEFMLYAARVGRTLAVMGRNPSNSTGYRVINPGMTNLQPTTKTDLANKLLELVPLYGRVWRSRYLSHGLEDALTHLQAPLKQLVPPINDVV